VDHRQLFRRPDTEKFHDGWLRTGDVGHLDDYGFVTITDRVKDVIKSGGEWISSVDLENTLMAIHRSTKRRWWEYPTSVGASGRWPSSCAGPGRV